MNERQNIATNINREPKKFIDIESIFAKKNSRLSLLMPKFLINYLKRITHEQKINDFVKEHQGIEGIEFAEAILKHFGVKLKIYGIENLDTNSKILIASNHPLGGLDSVGLIYACSLKKSDLVFPVNDILMNLPGLNTLFVPINKHGAQAKDSIKELDNAFNSEKTVLFFPAGLVSRKTKGVIKDLDWKKTFIIKAKNSKRLIIPSFIDGRNSNFFYNLANLRKFLGIKQNIEMLYLVNEMYKQYDKEISIYFGKAVSLNELPSNLKDKNIAQMIREFVYQIPGKYETSDNFISFDFKNN